MSEQADIAVDADSLRFLGHVLEAYFAWRSSANKLGFASASKVMQPPQPLENRRIISMSDDQFVVVDQAYSRCDYRPIIELEYGEGGSYLQKARRYGFDGSSAGAVIGKYKACLRLAEVQLFCLLTPHIQEWQDKRERESL